MKFSSSFALALAAASTASAMPLVRRQTGSNSTSSGEGSMNTTSPDMGMMTFNDTQILQYALTLEHLEATFYNTSLSNFSASDFESAGYNRSVRNQIYSIGRDEAAHVELLTTALGNMSVPACTYNFSSVTDVPSFLATARVLEGVGVSAYLGAAQNITNKAYLETAGSILTVEARHSSYLISQTFEDGNVIPGAFDTPLDFRQVYSLAAPFISSCPGNATLPITAFPALTLDGNGTLTPGQQITVTYDSGNMTTSNSTSSSNSSMSDDGSDSSNQTYVALIQGPAMPVFISLPSNGGEITLPSNLTGGQLYAVVTSSNDTVTDDNTLAGPAIGYVSIPLPEAPEASSSSGNASSTSSSASGSASSSASASASATASGSSDGGAMPTGSASLSALTILPTPSAMSSAA